MKRKSSSSLVIVSTKKGGKKGKITIEEMRKFKGKVVNSKDLNLTGNSNWCVLFYWESKRSLEKEHYSSYGLIPLREWHRLEMERINKDPDRIACIAIKENGSQTVVVNNLAPVPSLAYKSCKKV